MGLVISLSASWITALACIQGLTHREGVFLRTSKTASDHHRLRTALRLTRVETLLAVALFTAVGLLIACANPPLLLIVIITLQGAVYVCAPVAAMWNLRAQRVPAEEFRRRHAAPPTPPSTPEAVVRHRRFRRRPAPRRAHRRDARGHRGPAQAHPGSFCRRSPGTLRTSPAHRRVKWARPTWGRGYSSNDTVGPAGSLRRWSPLWR